MKQDEIIEMARQAGIIAIHTEGDGNWHQQFVALAAFAKLVAAKEREWWKEHIKKDIDTAKKEEREACAKVADEFKKQTLMEWPDKIADAIRARGTA